MLNHIVSHLPAHVAERLPSEVDRRCSQRVELPFSVTVRGVDSSGERFEVRAALDNMSACGMYLRLKRPVVQRERLFLVVRLSTAPAHVPAPCVALYGTILRTEAQADGQCGIAVQFKRYRFLYANTDGVGTR